MLDYTSRYDVVYTTSTNGVIHHCDNETILTDSCVNDICISSLSFLSGSQTQCASGDDIVVSVYATNGRGVAVTNSTAGIYTIYTMTVLIIRNTDFNYYYRWYKSAC